MLRVVGTPRICISFTVKYCRIRSRVTNVLPPLAFECKHAVPAIFDLISSPSRWGRDAVAPRKVEGCERLTPVREDHDAKVRHELAAPHVELAQRRVAVHLDIRKPEVGEVAAEGEV